MPLAIGSLRPANVVQQCGAVEKLTLSIRRAGPGTQAVNNLQGEPDDLIGMTRLLVIAGAQREGFFNQHRHNLKCDAW